MSATFTEKVSFHLLRHQAAEMLALWIQQVRVYPDRPGITPEDLAGLVCRPEPVFTQVFARLRESPDFDVERLRASKRVIAAMGQERPGLPKEEVARNQGRDDYWQILRQDVLHEACHDHALLLASPEVWPHFCRQMDMARETLLAV